MEAKDVLGHEHFVTQMAKKAKTQNTKHKNKTKTQTQKHEYVNVFSSIEPLASV